MQKLTRGRRAGGSVGAPGAIAGVAGGAAVAPAAEGGIAVEMQNMEIFICRFVIYINKCKIYAYKLYINVLNLRCVPFARAAFPPGR